MKVFHQVLLIAVCGLSLTFTSCKKNNPVDANPTAPTFQSVTRSGTLNLVEGSTVKPSGLNVVTFAGSAPLDEQGKFSVQATNAIGYQQLLFTSKTSGKLVSIGLYDPATKTLTANDTSTVVSLLLFNPALLNTTQALRQQYIQTAEQNSRFPQLLSLYRQAMQSNADSVFSFNSNPIFFQTAAQIMIETVQSIASGSNGTFNKPNNVLVGGTPTIENGSGNNIIFDNPTNVYYCAGVYPNNNSQKDVATINPQPAIVQLQWAWPPVTVNQPEQTDYSLGDGNFRIYLAKGLDFSKWNQWNNPVGRATICNTAQIILSVIDLVMGFVPTPNIANLPNHLVLSASDAYSLGRNIEDADVLGFVTATMGVISENADAIALWVWEDAANEAEKNAAATTVKVLGGIAGDISLAYTLISVSNSTGPFFYDLIFAPKELNYYVTKQNGTFSLSEEDPPTASFTISPPAGIVATNFQFAASASIDNKDNLSQLKFRWDWKSDGTWTDWSNSYTTTHSYSTPAAYVVTLEVENQAGLIGTVSHTVNVGGGAGTASHVKLFMDIDPWNSDAMIRMLQSLGFTQGTGQKTYEVLGSSSMGTASLIPGQDLIIISNDQTQDFYNNYANNQIRFTNFVNNGGSLFWEACDNGWNYGSMQQAGIILPGYITSNFNPDFFNYVANPNLPLVAGLPDTLEHNYASHERFTNLQDGTTIYCVDSDNLPTLIEFKFGAGWIIVTGQPLEHIYDDLWGTAAMQQLLPRIVAYFTGNPIPAKAQRKVSVGRILPSYIPKHSSGSTLRQ